ncbi:unnamed protein product [Lymnaea stagnalis]|uniref:Uncharacterized protein n=1 Tax=Lymnaea stagnalis TaxID=6523 RepID=A0AAV2H1C6_LYMST
MSLLQCMMIIVTVGPFTNCFSSPTIRFSPLRAEDCGARCDNDKLFYADTCILISNVSLNSEFKDVLASFMIKENSSHAESQLDEFRPHSICEKHNSKYDYDCEKETDGIFKISIYLHNYTKFVGAQIKGVLKRNEVNQEYDVAEQMLPAQFGTVTINGQEYTPESCDAIINTTDLNLQFNCSMNNKDCWINITANNTQIDARTNHSSLFKHTFNNQQEVVEVKITYDICDHKRIYNSKCIINAGLFKTKEEYSNNDTNGNSLAWIAGVILPLVIVIVLCSLAFRYRRKIKRCSFGQDIEAPEGSFSTLGPKYMKKQQPLKGEASPGASGDTKSGDTLMQKKKQRKKKKEKKERASLHDPMELTAFLSDTKKNDKPNKSDLEYENETPHATTDNGQRNNGIQDENETPSTTTDNEPNNSDLQEVNKTPSAMPDKARSNSHLHDENTTPNTTTDNEPNNSDLQEMNKTPSEMPDKARSNSDLHDENTTPNTMTDNEPNNSDLQEMNKTPSEMPDKARSNSDLHDENTTPNTTTDNGPNNSDLQEVNKTPSEMPDKARSNSDLHDENTTPNTTTDNRPSNSDLQEVNKTPSEMPDKARSNSDLHDENTTPITTTDNGPNNNDLQEVNKTPSVIPDKARSNSDLHDENTTPITTTDNRPSYSDLQVVNKTPSATTVKTDSGPSNSDLEKINKTLSATTENGPTNGDLQNFNETQIAKTDNLPRKSDLQEKNKIRSTTKEDVLPNPETGEHSRKINFTFGEGIPLSSLSSPPHVLEGNILQRILEKLLAMEAVQFENSQVFDNITMDGSQEHYTDASLQEIPCTNNQGHTRFFPYSSLEEDVEQLRPYKHIIDFIKVVADLTVMVSVLKTSEIRQKDPCFKVAHPDRIRFGTGMMMHFIKINNTDKQYCQCRDCKVQNSHRSNFFTIYICTTSNVVYDKFEATETTFRLFYNESNSRPINIDCCGLEFKDCIGHLCILKCNTHDMTLGEQLKQLNDSYTQLQGESRYHNLNDPIVIVSHPHGCAKHISIGKLKDKQETSHGRTQLKYDAPTCVGCSGAFVCEVDTSEESSSRKHFHFGRNSEGENISTISVRYCQSQPGVFSLS